MGMMGMFKWLRKDGIQRERNGWNLTSNQYGLNNESYRNALQAFIDRRRFLDDAALETDASGAEKNRVDIRAKNNNNKCGNGWKTQDTKQIIPGVPHARASEIFEIGCIPGTEDKYLELIFAEWQNTRVSLKRHTHPECKDAVKADLEVLSEIRHPNVLLLMATTTTDDHGLVSIFESVDCTLYNYIHEQGERISIQGIAKIGGKLSDALRHSHMRGYIHSAISSHCIYLASNGIVKLGGWELAVQMDNPKPDREYEERLRAEIFRWQAPELFYGCESRKESDVYGLSLLIWEMCTTHVPWSGYNRADVERQYVHWKRSVITDLYEFPPLLCNLLEAGLQIDVTKRTLDMNRMRRFLQRLEMQYEDKEEVYIDQHSNNNNESEKSYSPCLRKSPTGGIKKRNTRLAKSASAKQLACSVENPESPNLYPYQKQNLSSSNANSKITTQTQQVNLLDFNQQKRNTKDNTQKNMNILFRNDYKKINPPNLELEEWDNTKNEDDAGKTVQPWNRTYTKAQEPKKIESRNANISMHLNTSPAIESTDDDDSYKDARANLKQLREFLANRREHFFYGNESSSISLDASPRTKNRIFTQARSKDYEPHKPASHKTSLEPKCNKSPGQYDATYLKTSSQQYRKMQCAHVTDCIKSAIMHPQELDSETQSFFESSLWRKEKLICISKMRKDTEEDDSTSLSEKYASNSNNTDATCTQNQFMEVESLKSSQTYVVNNETEADDSETNHQMRTSAPESTSSSSGTLSPGSKPLRVLKDALDRATEIVRSVTPNTDESCSSPPFKNYENFEMSADEKQACRLIFEDVYDLNSHETGEIRSIERSTNGNNTFLLDVNNMVSTVHNADISKQLDNNATISTKYENSSYAPHNFTYTKSFVCDSIFEVSGESNTSCSHTASCTREYPTEESQDLTKTDASSRIKTFEANASSTETETHKTSKPNDQFIAQNLALKLLNDSTKYKNCNSCQKNVLPRRRSLPAALSQLRTLNNTTLGKLPIRKADVQENTVEDLYIDDEFGDRLNVNMILLQEEILLDEDFLPEISEL